MPYYNAIKNKIEGFTLIELMIVIAIVGLIAATAMPKFSDLLEKAREARTKGNLSAIRSALYLYYGSNAEGLMSPVLLSGLVTGNYISKIPQGNVPYVDTNNDGIKDESYSWVDNTPSVAADYNARGTLDKSASGWAYDSDEPEVWVEFDSNSFDTSGKAIYLW